MTLPRVALIGRPNVGKSTLFNRLVGRRTAIARKEAGVTRDRRYGTVELGVGDIELVDTGGVAPPGDRGTLLDGVAAQSLQAAQESVLTVLVCDGRQGCTPADEELARRLRRLGGTVIVVVNKCDAPRERLPMALDFHALGFGTPIAVSAETGGGVEVLEDRIAELVSPVPNLDAPRAEVRVAVVGRPNVGKSTLVNSLFGSERVLVSEVAGTTRDAIEVRLPDSPIVLVDTAGIRKKAKVEGGVERFSVAQALQAMRQADVALLVLDATQGAHQQEAKLLKLAVDDGRGVVLCLNKVDALVGPKSTVDAQIAQAFRFAPYLPRVFLSAKTHAGLQSVIPAIIRQHRGMSFRASTPKLNRLLDDLQSRRSPPALRGRTALRLYYVAQVGVMPPAFAVVCNAPAQVPTSYARFIENGIRAAFELEVPIRVFWRERPGHEGRKRYAQRAQARAKHK